MEGKLDREGKRKRVEEKGRDRGEENTKGEVGEGSQNFV